MRKIYQVLGAFLIVLGLSFSAAAQKGHFVQVSESEAKQNAVGKHLITPQKFSTFKLSAQPLKQFLWSLPSERNVNPKTAPVMEVPMPDGSVARFRVWESSIQEPGLQAKFPEIRTFAGQGIDDPYATIRLDYTAFGFHAQILSPFGRVYVDPYARGDVNYYMSYYTTDNVRDAGFSCVTPGRPEGIEGTNLVQAGPCRGTEIITYRLAVACTGEYAVAVGGTTAALLHSAIVTTVNRVTGVYQADIAVKLVLIANNDQIEFLDADTDPFSGNNNANTLISESQAQITNIIGNGNFDIGHTFSTGGGGLAGLGVVCRTGQKARGITGSPQPFGDNYDIDYVAHEMGHQFGANHTFNSTSFNCASPNRNASTAYEVGSGTSIMAYAGICGSTATGGDNIQAHSDPYFHPVSFDEISNYLSGTGGTCGVKTPTGNTLPVITSMGTNGLTIPINTPFTLVATATDADGDPLTYDWEEWDLGPTTVWNGGNANTTSPLFKARIPKTTGSRTFPDPAVIAAGFPANPAGTMGGLKGETLPTSARAMKFRLEVRDNQSIGGGVVTGGDGCQSTGVFTVNTAGSAPFVVTVPNGGESYAGNTTQTVTWNVVGTNAAPFNVTNVKISLSTDGGLTFPTVLLASTANDGSEPVTLPATASTTARIKVEAIGNIFFDISNTNFTITAPVTGFGLTQPAATTIACGGPATATSNLATTSIGGYTTPINLTATAGVPAGTTVSFAPATVTPGNTSVVTLNNANTLAPGTYNVTVTGISGTLTQTQTVSFVVSPGTAPTLTGPVNATVCPGATATFSVTATGTPTGYQWQISTAAVPAFTNIGGATSASYTTPVLAVGDNGNQYRVIVSTQCASATSAAATVTVQNSPTISTQPANQTACVGSNTNFTVVASGTTLTYQWQISTTAVPAFTNIPGATNATVAVNSVTQPQNGDRYRVVITGACGAPITSADATLTVGDAASITTAPASQTKCVGENVTFNVVATGSNLTYQWQVSTAAVPAFTNIGGATASSYTITGVTAALSGNQYRVVVFSCTPTGVNSTAATLTVNTPVSIGTQPTATTVCAGATPSFTVAATGTNVTYQWQSAATCAGPWTNITGATAATLSFANVTTASAGAYRVVVTGACGAVNSDCVLLTVNTPVAITTQPTAFSICLPATTATFTVAATGTGLAYQWQVSTAATPAFTNITGATAATLTINPLTANLNGNKYRVVLSGTCTPSLNSDEVTLTVNSPVAITTQPQSTAKCTGETATFSVVATGSTITYQWQASVNAGPYFNLTNAAPYSGVTTSTLSVANVGSLQNGVTYRVIVSGVPCGAVTSSVATLTVNPTPTVVLNLGSYSRIDPYVRATLTPVISPAGNYTYVWYKNNAVVPGVNSAILPVTVDDFGGHYVVVTNVATGCSAKSNEVTVTDSASNMLFVYPNPTSGRFEVRYFNRGGGAQSRTLNIYDSKGAKVFTKQYALTGVYAKMEVDLSAQGSGVYFIHLTDATGKRLADGKVSIRR